VLTPAGLAEIERAAPMHVASVRRHLIDVLDAEQLDQLADIAKRVVDHLRGESVCARVTENAEGSCLPLS
jgi:hypothetical protein